MQEKKKYEYVGYITFLLSGICAISSGIIVSILQEKYGFYYKVTGTLLAFMSVGNMLASFASGILPAKIGTKKTVAILCSGYALGYFIMSWVGYTGILIAGFLMVGIAKGCALNNCTVLVGNNAKDRTKGMNIMHAFYATGAMLCPFIIAFFLRINATFCVMSIAAVGAVLWIVFMIAGLPGKAAQKEKDKKIDFSFMKNSRFWLITALIFCQNAAETSVTGWMVTYYKGQGILSGVLSNYTITIMWGATLIARLLIAFVFPIKNTFRALALMGIGCSLFYVLLVVCNAPALAIIMLFGFSFSMAGVNPVAVAAVGKMMNATSMGVMLPLAGIGAIIMPWIIGIVSEFAGLKIGMITNLLPCIGIFILSFIMSRRQKA